MARIAPVKVENAPAPVAAVLNAVRRKLGIVPNLLATMANSPAVVNAYVGMSSALAGGSLSPQLREGISLTVGQANECDYCLAAHSAAGRRAGLSEHDVELARMGTADGDKERAALQFAQVIVEHRGLVSDQDVEAVRQAGFTDGEVAEIVANVALNIFTNYFNHVADTEIDFPLAPALVR
jgi:uncharacterized peroxidase-related enzyme